MRKRLISPNRTPGDTRTHDWMELGQAATVEVTSEAEAYPVEEALLWDGRGWRAERPGTQTIRLLFDQPQTIHLIRLVFREEARPRTQEFILRWLPAGTKSWKDIIRQQWNFSSPNTTEECENYSLNLSSVAALELTINPDISFGEACASVQRLQIAAHP